VLLLLLLEVVVMVVAALRWKLGGLLFSAVMGV
jgi:hypothetical protein